MVSSLTPYSLTPQTLVYLFISGTPIVFTLSFEVLIGLDVIFDIWIPLGF